METETMLRTDTETMIRVHQTGVWRYLRFLGCDPDTAADLTQETFLAVLQEPFDDYSQKATAAYLRNRARFLFLKSLRRTSPATTLEDLEVAEAVWQRRVGDTSGDAYLEALDSCLEGVGERAREALDLRYREGSDLPGIAERLDFSLSGIKSLLARAKKRLRVCIERRVKQ